MKILNETKYAEQIIEKGFSKNKIIFEIRILAKYFYSQGYEKEELKAKVNEFCNKRLSQFNQVTWIKTINKICKYAEKNSLFDVKSVRITMLEYDKIKSLNNKNLEKIAFVMLVLAKINKQSYMVYLKDRINSKLNNKVKREDIDYKFKGYYLNESVNEICKLAKVHGSKEKKLAMIKELWDLGFVHVGFPARLRVDFVNNHTTEDFVVLDKFNNFILEYEKTLGVKVKYCEVCGEIIKDTVNNKKYCNVCWKDEKRNQNKLWKRKYDLSRKAES